MKYSFLLNGRIKPYVRMTRRGKWIDPNAQEYLASQEAIIYQLKQQMSRNGWEMLPEKTPLKIEVTAIIPKRLYTFDVDNLGKAIGDAAQGTVFKNDLWITEARFTKVRGKDYQTYVFIETVGK